MSILNEVQRARLREREDFWLATVRPTGAPHLIPIWAVLVGEHLYMGTEPHSQKVRNILEEERAVLAIPDTRRVLILEGRAERLEGEPPEGVMARFQEKYDWTFDPADSAWILVRFTPDRILSWNS